jgi:hypothetical protein
VAKECPSSSFYFYYHHGRTFCGESAVDDDFQCYDVLSGSYDITGAVQPVAPHREPDELFFFFVGFAITNYFAVSDFSVLWNVFKFHKETCVGAGDVTNALKEASFIVAKTSFPKWLKVRILHEGHVFHLFSGDWVKTAFAQCCWYQW